MTQGGNSLTINKIRQIKDETDQFFEYHKRIIALRRYIEKYPNLRIKYAKELIECQEEQKKIRLKSRAKDLIEKKEQRLNPLGYRVSILY
jgi:hypothetical protein